MNMKENELYQLHESINSLIENGNYTEAKKLISRAEKLKEQIERDMKEGIVTVKVGTIDHKKPNNKFISVICVINGTLMAYDVWNSPMDNELVESLVIENHKSYTDYSYSKKIPKKYKEGFQLLRSHYNVLDLDALEHGKEYSIVDVPKNYQAHNVKKIVHTVGLNYKQDGNIMGNAWR